MYVINNGKIKNASYLNSSQASLSTLQYFPVIKVPSIYSLQMRSDSKNVNVSEKGRGLLGEGTAVQCCWREQSCPSVPSRSLASLDYWNNICWLL